MTNTCRILLIDPLKRVVEKHTKTCTWIDGNIGIFMVYDVNDYDIAIANLMTIGRRFWAKCQSAVVSYLNTNIRALLFQCRSLFFICKVETPHYYWYDCYQKIYFLINMSTRIHVLKIGM